MRREENALRVYSRAYESLARLCAAGHETSSNAALLCVEAAATFASAHHPGRLGDGMIENVAFRIGATLGDTPHDDSPACNGRAATGAGRGRARRVLHVSPFLWRVGGHTRTLQNWIRLDRDSSHFVALTQSMDPMLLPDVRNDVEESGGEIFVLPPAMNRLEKARALRAIAKRTADLIVLHHTCNDVVPIVALARKDIAPVALVNDCDQAFWLGCSVADLVVNQREAGARLSRERRSARRNAVLPIPLLESAPGVSRDEARRGLEIPADALMLLTVGRAIKYRPSGSHDFFRTVRRVLDAEPRAHLYVVGLGDEEASRWQLDCRHPRVHLCGARSDLSMFWSSADLYLESMPFGSATALMEAVHAGVPAVLPFAPPFDLFVTNHGLESILRNPATEADYVSEVLSLLRDGGSRVRRAEALRQHLSEYHTSDGWRRQLAGLYALTDAMVHDPGEVPQTRCADSPLDRALSEWHSFLEGEPGAAPAGTEADLARQTALEAAAVARERGDYLDAAEIVRRYVAIFGFDRPSTRLAIGLPAWKVRRIWQSLRSRQRARDGVTGSRR